MPWIRQPVKSVWSDLAVGDFQWLVCTKYGDPKDYGILDGKAPIPDSLRLFNLETDKHPTHLRLRIPGGLTGSLALRGKGTQSNGESWEWDGDLEAPTLTPSIDHKEVWHGWLTKGKLRPA